MGAPRKAVILASVLMASMMSSGCLALSMQREIMEGMREPPETILKDETIGMSATYKAHHE